MELKNCIKRRHYSLSDLVPGNRSYRSGNGYTRIIDEFITLNNMIIICIITDGYIFVKVIPLINYTFCSRIC